MLKSSCLLSIVLLSLVWLVLGTAPASAASSCSSNESMVVVGQVLAIAGDGQSATVNTAFATALQFKVYDPCSSPLSGVSVTITTPTTGASATFSNSSTSITLTTNSSGIVTASVTANGTAGGPYTVTATAAGTPGTASLTNTASQALTDQTITFGALSDKNYGDAAFGLSATATSTLTVTFASTTTSVCTVSGTTLTIVASGSCSITASQLGNGSYNPAPDVPRSFTVNKAPLTVSAQGASITYGAAFPTFTANITGLQYSDTLSVVTGSPAFSTNATTTNSKPNVGSWTITPAINTLAAANYTFSFATGTLTVGKAPVTVTAQPQSILFGQSPNLTGTSSAAVVVTGLVNGDTVATSTPTLTTNATLTSGKPNAGSWTITPAAGTISAANYTINLVTGALTVGGAPLTVTAAGGTRPYGAPNSFGYSISGFVGNDTIAVVTGTAGLNSLASTTTTPGTYSVNATLGTLSAANYVFTFQSGSVVITKAPAALGFSGISPGPTASVGQSFTLTYIVGGVPFGAFPSGSVTYTVDGGAAQTATLTNGSATATIAGLAVGAHTVLSTYGGDGNYLPTSPTPATLTIIKGTAQLVVVASPATLPQGQSFTLQMTVAAGGTAPLTGTVSCTVDKGTTPQTATLSTGSASLAITGLTLGTHTVACSYSGDANYPAATASVVTLTVTQALPVINPGGVVSAAGGVTSISPAGLLSVYGANLLGTSTSSPGTSANLPLTLSNTQLLINGAPAPLLSVSATQINCQAPSGTPVGTPVPVVVIVNGVSSLPVNATFTTYAPALFTYSRTATSVDPVITHADGSLVTPDKPAQPGEILVMYATGAGKLNNAPADGATAPASPTATTVDKPTVTLGASTQAVAATVLFSGLTPGYVGLLQLNIQLPATLPAGTGTPPSLPLVIAFPGSSSAPANLWVSR